MTAKKYFIVGPAGSGTVSVVADLANSFRDSRKSVSIRTLGVPKKLKNAGTKRPEETLEKIVEFIAEDDAENDVILFVGWRIPDHINEIYAQYGNDSTFIFTDFNTDNYHNRKFLEKFNALADIDSIIAAQKESISSFIQNQSLNLNFQSVGEPAFDSGRVLNTVDSSDIKVAILGSM